MKLKDIISGKINEVKMTPAKVQKAQKDLVMTIDALKKNFPMYKAAKESGDEKKLKKHRDIALKLTKKKKDLEIALDKALGGLYQDAELELKESILGQMPSDKLMKMKWNPLAEAPQADITGGAAIGDDGTERAGAEFSQQIKAKLGRAKGKLAIAFGSLDDKTVERLSKLNVQQQVELVATLLTAFGIDEKSFRQLRQRVLKQLQEPQEES